MKARDLRKYARQTTTRLLVLGLLLLFIVGDGLIYLFYGSGAAILGLTCLGIGLAPVVLIFLFLQIVDWILRHANHE